MTLDLETTEISSNDPYDIELSTGEKEEIDFSLDLEDNKGSTISEIERTNSGELSRDQKQLIVEINRLLSRDLYISQNTAAATQSDLKKEMKALQDLYEILNDPDRIESDTEIPKYVSRNTVSEEDIDGYIYQSVQNVLDNSENFEETSAIDSYLSEYYGLEKDTLSKIDNRLISIESYGESIEQMKEYYNRSIKLRQRKFTIESVSMIILGISIISGMIGLLQLNILQLNSMFEFIGIFLTVLIGTGFMLAGALGIRQKN